MVKLLENTFRMINIGLVNEMAHDVRPHGHQRLGGDRRRRHQAVRLHAVLPGPGLGGHCIPIDPFYLSWKTKQAGIEARFIELAGYINGQMPHFVVDKMQNALNDHAQAAQAARAFTSWVWLTSATSTMCGNRRRSISSICSRSAARSVTYSDPFIPKLRLDGGREVESQDLETSAANADCVVVVTDHSNFNYEKLLASSKLIV